MKKASLLCIATAILMTVSPSFAGDLEGTLAGSFTKYNDSDASYGMSARLRYFFSSKSSSFFIQSNFPGGSFFMFDAMVGYSFRSEGPVFFEGGGGFRYSPLWGSGFAAVGGMGASINDHWYINLPIIYRFGLQLEVTPYIGYRF
ncbi:hypothetical protein K2X30_12370 [bacterium]|nr:hypothetical protein [bacterium]